MYLYSAFLFHNITEMCGIIVAFGIFMLAWNSRKFQDNHFFLFLGIAYFFVGILEVAHVLVGPGLGVFQSHGLNLSAQVRIAARYVESISLLIAPLFIRRKLKHEYLFLGYTSTVFFLLWSIFYKKIFPVCFISGIGLTPFGMVSEYIIWSILLAACGILIQKRKEFDPRVLYLLVASVILTIGSELAYTR